MKIQNTTYAIEARNTIDELIDYPNYVAFLREQNVVAELIVRRPKGRVTWLVREYEDGQVAIVTKL